MPLRWDDQIEGLYPVAIRIEMANKRGMIATLATKLSGIGLNIERISTLRMVDDACAATRLMARFAADCGRTGVADDPCDQLLVLAIGERGSLAAADSAADVPATFSVDRAPRAVWFAPTTARVSAFARIASISALRAAASASAADARARSSSSV